jgi:GNAT superfamily N-acetyltransferase
MDIKIRVSRQEDFCDIFNLFHQLWPGKELNKEALETVFKRGLQSETDYYISAELEGRVIGFCAGAIVNNFWQEGIIAYVYAMVVEEEYRGQGFGTSIIDKACEYAKERGCKKLELDSAFHREGAHKFYEKLGFVKRAFLFSKDI